MHIVALPLLAKNLCTFLIEDIPMC